MKQDSCEIWIDFREHDLPAIYKDQNHVKIKQLNVFRIEKIKSDIRRIINRKFIENGITIPFPQMDVYFKEKK